MRPGIPIVLCTVFVILVGAAVSTVSVSAQACPTVITVDLPSPNAQVKGPTTIAGWAIDPSTAAGSQSGIQEVIVYRDGEMNSGGVLVGNATKIARPDVDAVYGLSGAQAGWQLTADFTSLPPGPHTLYVYARSSCGLTSRTQPVVAPAPAAEISIDSPGAGQAVNAGERINIGGWAVMPGGTGTGVDQVHIYANGPIESGGVLLGAATYGKPRADVAAAKGKPEYTNSGFDLNWTVRGVTNGKQTLYVYAHSTVNDQWSNSTVDINVSGSSLNSNVDNSGSGGSNTSGSGNCGAGYYWNGNTCVNSGGSGNCQAGYYWNGSQCVYGSGSGSGYCQPSGNGNGYYNQYGQFFPNYEQCIASGGGATGNCQPGYYFNGSQCVSGGSSGSQYCQPGYYYNGSTCVAGSGSGNCGQGSYWNGYQCVYGGGSGNCQAGSYWNGSQCVYGSGSGNCGQGSYWNGYQCVYGGGSGNCQPGYYNYQGTCIPI